MVWDAPGHGQSRPFEMIFSLTDEARWLHDIIVHESVNNPVLIGQSKGGYVAQTYMQLFPNDIHGFISLDSAPLLRKYTSSMDLWTFRNSELMFRMCPWKLLVKATSFGCSQTEYGRKLMKDMMLSYSKDEYCSLAGFGYRIIAQQLETSHTLNMPCPVLLVCGDKDYGASRYNKLWGAGENLPIKWVPAAGHNSNTDRPDLVNHAIDEFLLNLINIH